MLQSAPLAWEACNLKADQYISRHRFLEETPDLTATAKVSGSNLQKPSEPPTAHSIRLRCQRLEVTSGPVRPATRGLEPLHHKVRSAWSEV